MAESSTKRPEHERSGEKGKPEALPEAERCQS